MRCQVRTKRGRLLRVLWQNRENQHLVRIEHLRVYVRFLRVWREPVHVRNQEVVDGRVRRGVSELRNSSEQKQFPAFEGRHSALQDSKHSEFTSRHLFDAQLRSRG